MPKLIQTPALFFDPDAYDAGGPKLMGRQAAGNGFLRALVAAAGGAPIVGYGPTLSHRRRFAELVSEIDPAASTRWLTSGALEEFETLEVCHRADPVLAGGARLRLRAGPAAYSLTGITHTLSSSLALEAIAAQLREPLETWDALICTSHAAAEVARGVLEAESDYLRWRLGQGVDLRGPQLPIIPLGVHSVDYQFSPQQRADARRDLGIEDDEVVALYVGRLSFHAKAHPYALFSGLQLAAERTGKKVCILLYGQAPTDFIDATFRQGAADYAPNVRTIFLDGRQVDAAKVWPCGDIFVSLADSVQETFGLTPIEAMAAGLPCVVTDWDGYKDTVREGLDGFRVRTWLPAAGAGAPLASAYEAGTLDYNLYNWKITGSVTVDLGEVASRLTALIVNPDLRARMGAAGRARVGEVFEWRQVYRQYQELWTELRDRRTRAAADPDEVARMKAAPSAASMHRDPFKTFESYPSGRIRPSTRLRRLAPETSRGDLHMLLTSALFRHLSVSPENLSEVLSQIDGDGTTVRALAGATSHHEAAVIRAVGALAKMGLVELLID